MKWLIIDYCSLAPLPNIGLVRGLIDFITAHEQRVKVRGTSVQRWAWMSNDLACLLSPASIGDKRLFKKVSWNTR
ncbi:hypothetical protein AB9M62_08650 [Bacillales bacterium AN1005]